MATVGVSVVVAGGPDEPGARDVAATLLAEVAAGGGPGPWVVAADSGVERARALGLHVDLVVGDMDSVAPGTLDAVARAGTTVNRHPEAKDATDLDLALDAALARGPARLVVVGSAGGRLDHLLALVTALAAPRLAGVAVEAAVGRALVVVVRPGATARLAGAPGDLVSLLPVGGPARGVTTSGLLYPLAGEDLPAGTSRGVSNEVAAAPATVRLEEGVLVAVLPGEQGSHVARGLGPRPG